MDFNNDFREEMVLSDIDKFTKYFMCTLGVIVISGIIMVYSSSYIYAKEVFGTSTYFFVRQLIFILLGLMVVFVVAKTKLTFWVKFGFYINLAVTFFLVCTFVPGLGQSVKGSSRWINLYGASFQPGEMVKYSIMLVSVYLFENFSSLSLNDRIKYGVSILIPMGILILQPDFGTFFICFIVTSFVCFMSSFNRKHFYGAFTIGTIAGMVILFLQSYRVERIFAFLDPWKNAKTSGFQIIQSYLAFANGGFFGQGLGNSNEKLFYLPEAHNDFIFSVIGEELGFVGVTLIILMFVAFIYLGFKLSIHVKDRLGLVIISSVIFIIGIQTLLNMGVVLGLLPTKGLNLPFISYGGSSIVSNFFGIGLVLSSIRFSRKRDAI